MMDSCSPRKLEPGFEEMYSSPMDFRTSTMKSDPLRSVVSTSTCEGSSSFGSIAAEAERGASPCAARTGVAPATSEATPPAAAPFRNLRRSTDSFLAMAIVLCGVVFEHPGQILQFPRIPQFRAAREQRLPPLSHT